MKAFPCEWSEWDPEKKVAYGDSVNGFIEATGAHVKKSSTGMDLRDYFAAKASERVGLDGPPEVMLASAKRCYRFADAMMEARKND